MSNILVVSGDRSFLQGLKTAFEKSARQYRLYLADNGPQGLKILQKEKIDFVAATLLVPQMDGDQFLTNLRLISPSVPTVIMTSDEATYMGSTFLKMNVLKVLLEPVTANQLLECIKEVLFLKTQQGRLQGISIVNFLQLIELEKKTYLLEVRNPAGGTGLFYFREGVLYDALFGELNSEAAALEMITWDNVEIHFRPPPTQKVRRRIKKSLMSLLMDGVAIKDERSYKQTPDPEPEEDVQIEEAPTLPVEKHTTSSVGEPGKSAGYEEPQKEKGLTDIGQCFQELYDIRGVKAAILIDREGGTIAKAGSWPGAELADLLNPIKLVHGGANRMIKELQFEELRTLTLESDGVVIICIPVKDTLLAILAPDSRTLGIIRQKALKLSLELGRLQI